MIPPVKISGVSEEPGLAPAQQMGAAYGLLLLRYREEKIWLEFRAGARFAIAL